MRIALACLFAAAAVTLAACGKEEAPAPSSAATAGSAAAQKPAAVDIDAIASKAQGFSVGPAMSARVVYVFFDAQCPHCAALWEFAKPLKTQARFVWLPISLLNGNSTTQGAAILASPDPAAAMEGHEASMREKQGGIVAQGNIEPQLATVKSNTELFNKYGFNSVPALVTKNAQSGAVVTHEGAMPTAELASWLGVQTTQQ
ncbi:MAG TPA: DsbC family protein [Ramlibacter sp.]|uniref:DsbC family protein n=1 Tax=Ramlibacter sp. TaxID=1917967 RepID=UPI002C96940A|nr:DsbC family protein [Ramlibacter sp.]HVZ42901.1 DsbC family protein [Ramlibacter sp.]